MAKRRIVKTRQDGDGDITHVKFAGNQRFTPLETAVRIAERGNIDRVHAVRPRSGNPHIRSNPDGRICNNLDEMAD